MDSRRNDPAGLQETMKTPTPQDRGLFRFSPKLAITKAVCKVV